MSKLKILLVHNYYQRPGGEDAVFHAERNLLREMGHKVVEYTDHNNRIKHMNPLSIALNSIWSSDTKKKLLRILKEEKPDIAHFHNTFPLISPSAYYACKEAEVPVVQTLHNYRLLCPAAIFYRNGKICEECIGNKKPLYKTPEDYKKLETFQTSRPKLPWPSIVYGCYHSSRIQTAAVAIMLSVHRLMGTWQNMVNTYIALTEFSGKKFIEGGFPSDKIAVKPNFIIDNPGIKEKDGSYALFVGRLSREKGIRTLLKAWEKLKGIPLKIAGDGPLINEVKNFVRKKKLNSIEIAGKCSRDEIVSLMKQARFLIFPSEWYETFGLVIIEAFAYGVTVISNSIGVMGEIIQDKVTGLHINNEKIDSLIDTIEWAWNNKIELRKISKEAKREFEKKYTHQENYKSLYKIYEKYI